jgi:hypothetical protein
MRALFFEGDPSEVAQAITLLGLSTAGVQSQHNASSSSSEASEEDGEGAGGSNEDGGPSVVDSVAFARKVLKRRALAPNQKNLLAEIYNAGDAGILGSELVGKMGLSQSQFRGTMGAWGRRVSNTPGYDGESSFFAWEWDYDAKSYRYWLPAAVREAVQRDLIDRK